MGDQVIHTEAAESPQSVVSSYRVITYPGPELPGTYRPMILSKWLRSLRFGNDMYRLIDTDAYYRVYHALIEKILAQPETTVMIAALSEDPDVVIGFSVSRGTILDYVHVPREQRQQKIGTSLVPEGIDTITHLTKTALSIWGSKYGSWKFNPFA